MTRGGRKTSSFEDRSSVKPSTAGDRLAQLERTGGTIAHAPGCAGSRAYSPRVGAQPARRDGRLVRRRVARGARILGERERIDAPHVLQAAGQILVGRVRPTVTPWSPAKVADARRTPPTPGPAGRAAGSAASRPPTCDQQRRQHDHDRDQQPADEAAAVLRRPPPRGTRPLPPGPTPWSRPHSRPWPCRSAAPLSTYLAVQALVAPVSPLVFRSSPSCSASGVAVDARWCSTRPGVGSNGSQP